MDVYRNQGGFDMICSGRDKIEKEEEFLKSMEICQYLDLHGLVVIGGDDSNTNACVLAEYFKKNKCKTKYFFFLFCIFLKILKLIINFKKCDWMP